MCFSRRKYPTCSVQSNTVSGFTFIGALIFQIYLLKMPHLHSIWMSFQCALRMLYSRDNIDSSIMAIEH